MRGAAIRTRQAEKLSRELRRGESAALARRRGVVALSFVSAGAMQVVGLYQIGLLRHIPEPPLPRLAGDRIDASADGYRYLSLGNAFLGLLSYGATAALAAAGPADRARSAPWLPLALSGKALYDAVQAARLARLSWSRHRAFCFWCLLAAGATFAALPLTVAEARAALRHAAH